MKLSEGNYKMYLNNWLNLERVQIKMSTKVNWTLKTQKIAISHSVLWTLSWNLGVLVVESGPQHMLWLTVDHKRSGCKTLPLFIGVDAACLLAKCLTYHWIDLIETHRN